MICDFDYCKYNKGEICQNNNYTKCSHYELKHEIFTMSRSSSVESIIASKEENERRILNEAIGKSALIVLKENELYQEIELFIDEKKIGEAEIEMKGKMLSRLSIFPPYQNQGYGTQIIDMLNKKYGCEALWVNADNKRAIHTYEKNGYVISEPAMYLMKRFSEGGAE